MRALGRAIHLFVFSLLAACGSSAPPPAEEPAEETPPAPEPEPDPLVTLTAALAAVDAPQGVPATFGDALAACRSIEAEECQIPSLAGYDARRSRWILLDVDPGESPVPEYFWLGAATASEDDVEAEGVIDQQTLGLMRRSLRRFARQAVSPNLVAERSEIVFSLNGYAPLVALAAPFDGWLLYLETVNNLDAPEYVLHLMRRDHSDRVELARRPGARTPCDGDGAFGCTANPEGECTEDQLRADNRLCVQPLGIDRVALAPDGSSAYIGGTQQVAGHGGHPPYHWIIELPDAVRQIATGAPAEEASEE